MGNGVEEENDAACRIVIKAEDFSTERPISINFRDWLLRSR